ncbi:MAG TPA: helix-turn-helix transcriptional regulator, partial [Burkholderiaceae bacterium]|nr:helix-turn-helix transcriptional regulator [Burkholderiaceae bacterium]
LVTALPVHEQPRRAVLHVTPLPPALRAVWPRGTALLLLKLPPERAETRQWQQHLMDRYRLTPAETNVLRCLADGLSTRQVAEALGMSYPTVRTHLLALYQKTGCRRQAELVRLAA